MRTLSYSLVALLAVGCASASSDPTASTSDSDFTVAKSEIVASLDDVGASWRGGSHGTRVALSFEAAAGDEVDVWVRGVPQGTFNPNANKGDPIAWIVSQAGAVLAFDDDADASTKDAHLHAVLGAGPHYVVLRDKHFDTKLFDVAFESTCANVDAIKSVACGAGGKKEALCMAATPAGTNRWSAWGLCAGELPGGCVPGTVTTEACGLCGTRTKTCLANATWSLGTCAGEPINACTPGAVGESVAGCAQPGTFRHRTCSASCTWGAFSMICEP